MQNLSGLSLADLTCSLDYISKVRESSYKDWRTFEKSLKIDSKFYLDELQDVRELRNTYESLTTEYQDIKAEIDKRVLRKSEPKGLEKNNNRKKKTDKYPDEYLIKHFLEIAIPKGSIPNLKELKKIASNSTWSKRMKTPHFVSAIHTKLSNKLENRLLTSNYKDNIIRLKLELEAKALKLYKEQIKETKEDYPEKSDYREVPYPDDEKFTPFYKSKYGSRVKRVNSEYPNQKEDINESDFDGITIND